MIVVFAGVPIVSAQTPGVSEQALTFKPVKRSLSEFLAAQGTYCIPVGEGGCLTFLDPLPNFLGLTDENRNRCAIVDYAGIAHRWLKTASGGDIDLGTSISGSVKEVALIDRRAEITVHLDITNALIFTLAGCDAPESPAEFGRRVPEILAGGNPALGTARVDFRLIVAAPGLPLPDLFQVQIFPQSGQELELHMSQAHGEGPLRASFGVPDGTPGVTSMRYSYLSDDSTGHVTVTHGDILLRKKH